MDLHRIIGCRSIGVATAAALALGMATTGSAAATPYAGSASVSNDTLTVIGTRHADQIALRLAAGDPTTLQVDFGDDDTPDQSFRRDTFSRILVFLGSGSDGFRIDQTDGPFADEALTVFAASGNDTIAGGDGNELVLGGSGDDAFDGNRGVDTAELGTGEDSFTWDPGDGSDAVHGGRGSDTLVFNGSNDPEVMSLAANGSGSVFLRDRGNIRMDMTSVEVLELAALGGADSVTINDMSGTRFHRANIDLSALGVGDGQADVVTVSGTESKDRVRVHAHGTRVDVRGLPTETQVIGGELIDRLQVDARGGNDEVDVKAAARALIDVAVDLGTGQR